jgi:hypothetical protein
MAMHIVMARLQRIRVLSKWKPTLKSQILKKNCIKLMRGYSLWTFKITGKTKIDTHIQTTKIED